MTRFAEELDVRRARSRKLGGVRRGLGVARRRRTPGRAVERGAAPLEEQLLVGLLDVVPMHALLAEQQPAGDRGPQHRKHEEEAAHRAHATA